MASTILLALLRWREGAIRLPRGDLAAASALLGVIGFGCYQILWPIALQTIPAGDSGAAHRHDPGHDRAARGGGRRRHAERGQADRRVHLVRRRRVVIAAGQGLDLGASLVGDVLTLVAAACWAVYTVFGAPVLRAPLAAA